MNNRSFFGGIPTDVDVEMITKAIGVPKVGDKVTYAQIESVLRLKRTENRFITVVSAWRRKMDREHNLLMKAIPGMAFEVLDASGRVDLSSKVFKQALKRTGKAVAIAARTDRKELTEEEKKVCDHIQRTGATLRLEASKAARQIDWHGEKDCN